MHSQRMGALVCLLLSMLIALCPAALPLHAVAEEENVIYYIEPELPSDVEPYDPEHPEDLYEDQLYAKSAILIEASSGEVIFEKNADATMYPASTTKIMTVLLGIMMGDMNQTVYLSQTAADIGDDSSDMGLDVGESINFKDLLYGTMVRSANEGANLIAETLYGSVPAFAEVMNEAAAMYGCTGTHFANANGLHDPNHYTTARDMAKIAQAAMQNETFRDIAKTYTYSLPASNLHSARVLTSSSRAFFNPSLEENDAYYPYAIGTKTGLPTRRPLLCGRGRAGRGGADLRGVLHHGGRPLDRYGQADGIRLFPVREHDARGAVCRKPHHGGNLRLLPGR